MQISRVEFVNFKNFQHLQAEVFPGVNLLVGTNGSGKTSFLEGLCVAMGGFFGSQSQKMQRLIRFDEIRIHQGVRTPQATIKAFSPEIEGEWSRSIKQDTKSNNSSGIKPIREYGKRFFAAFQNPSDRSIAPLIAYYSTQRLFKEARKSQNQQYDAALGRENGYLQCLSEESIHPVLSEWLGNAVTRRATQQIKDIQQTDHALENVEAGIQLAIADFLSVEEPASLKIYAEPDFNNELFIQIKEGEPLPLSYFSDGYRNVLFLLIDLIWRASQLNPWLPLEELSNNISGVVMIDEIGLHLHPKWQGKVVPLLMKLFPQVQFFITTHSPTVVANFEGGHLLILEDDQVHTPSDRYFGKEINAVIRNILGATDRHVETQRKIDELFRLIEEGAEKEKIEMDLQKLEDILGKGDPEIQRAYSLISWNEYKQANPDAVHS